MDAPVEAQVESEIRVLNRAEVEIRPPAAQQAERGFGEHCCTRRTQPFDVLVGLESRRWRFGTEIIAKPQQLDAGIDFTGGVVDQGDEVLDDRHLADGIADGDGMQGFVDLHTPYLDNASEQHFCLADAAILEHESSHDNGLILTVILGRVVSDDNGVAGRRHPQIAGRRRHQIQRSRGCRCLDIDRQLAFIEARVEDYLDSSGLADCFVDFGRRRWVGKGQADGYLRRFCERRWRRQIVGADRHGHNHDHN